MISSYGFAICVCPKDTFSNCTVQIIKGLEPVIRKLQACFNFIYVSSLASDKHYSLLIVNDYLVLIQDMLMLSTLGKIQQMTFWNIVLIIPRETGFDISCKLSLMETICIKCQILFFGEKEENYHQFAICWISPDSGNWLCWGLTTHQPLWIILCPLPEKGRKEMEEIVEEMKERDREERGTGM